MMRKITQNYTFIASILTEIYYFPKHLHTQNHIVYVLVMGIESGSFYPPKQKCHTEKKKKVWKFKSETKRKMTYLTV